MSQKEQINKKIYIEDTIVVNQQESNQLFWAHTARITNITQIKTTTKLCPLQNWYLPTASNNIKAAQK